MRCNVKYNHTQNDIFLDVSVIYYTRRITGKEILYVTCVYMLFQERNRLSMQHPRQASFLMFLNGTYGRLFTYIDFRTLALFCLMAIRSYSKAIGAFDIICQNRLWEILGTVGAIRLLVPVFPVTVITMWH